MCIQSRGIKAKVAYSCRGCWSSLDAAESVITGDKPSAGRLPDIKLLLGADRDGQNNFREAFQL